MDCRGGCPSSREVWCRHISRGIVHDLHVLFEVGVRFCNWDLVPGSQSPGFGQGFAHERKTPKCSVDDHGDVDPGRLDIGMWESERDERGYSSGVDLVGASHHVGFSRL